MSTIHRIKLLSLALLVAVLGIASPRAQAQQAQHTNDVYNGFLSAYQVSDGSNFFFAKSLTVRTSGDWSEGYLITEAEDAYFQNRSAARYTQVTQLLNDFLGKYTSDWTGDTWDDDLEWMILAFVRGYEITGNTTYLTAAENNWNAVYSRGWDSDLGGGIWENMGKTSKCVLSNAPFVIEGLELYRITGTATYLTESENSYTWEHNNLFNYTTSSNKNGAPGQAGECIQTASGLDVSHNIYNMGLIVNAANSMYRVTQNSEYLSDAELAASRVMTDWPILNADYPQNGYFSADHFIRGLAALSTQNNLWSTYNTYLQNNSNAAWNERRTDYNISNNIWTSPTPTGTSPDLYSMEAAGSLTMQASMPTQFNLAGTYELQNVNSGLVVTVSGSSTSSGAAIVQSTYSTGANDQLWTFVPTAGGYYQIKNVNSGLVLNVEGHSTTSGALLQQFAAQTMVPGNDQWLPAQNTDGTFSFYNLNSNMALEAVGTASGTQFEQNFANNASDQKFNLIQPSLTFSGNYELANVNSGLAVNVKAASKSNGGIVQQYTFVSGQTNSLWNFVAAQPGYYRIQSVNSGLEINVTGASTSNGALLQQYTAVGSSPYNDQWRPVKNSDGSYSFYNSNSAQALDVPNASKTSGVRLDQWPDNGASNQSWNLSTH